MGSLSASWTAALLNDKKYADLTMICDGKSYTVHKAVVCSRSPVLAAACGNVVYEETTSGTVEVTVTSHRIFELVLKFLYTGSLGTYEERTSRANELVWSQSTESSCEDDATRTYRSVNAPLLLFIRLFQVADYYQIDHMKTEVCKELKLTAGLYWIMSSPTWPDWGKEIPNRLFECFADIVREAFEVSPPSEHRLQEALADLLEYHVAQFVKSDAFLGLAQDCPTFVQAVMSQELARLNGQSALHDLPAFGSILTSQSDGTVVAEHGSR
ncbi:MAG: hypothetical protein M1828_006236 [Chrysothrix sp. TS-e1954]|nr:MAG: hypothetical protein M1828_006236 [Chrysothrix sp. TS-e1954]